MVWIAWVLMLLIVFPLLTLFHELGHALPALAYGAQDVKVVLGPYDRERVTLRRQFGRLELILTSWFPLFMGHVRMSKRLPLRKRLQMLLGGPLVSLLQTVILVPLAYVSREASSEFVRILAQGTAAYAFSGLVMTALPMTYPRWFYGYAGHTNDMRKITQLLQSRNTASE